MRLIRSPVADDPALRGAAVALGNFDGVHLGHRALIERARAVARAAGRPLGVVTFEPHPRQVFAPDAPPFRLMNAEARANRMARLGVDILYEIPFDTALASLSPAAFAGEVLVRGLGVHHVAVGTDFRFGHGRAGTAEGLVALGRAEGFGGTVIDLVDAGGRATSSTLIRAALSEGRPEEAARMLGHWHRIEGEVLHGDRRGRALGFPTANMSLAGLHPPRFGVYAVRVDVLGGRHRGRHDAVASLGVRPMFGGGEARLESFLLDFAGDLYGAHLSVALVAFLRPEARFDSVAALVAAMHEDCARARAALAARGAGVDAR